MGDTIGAKAKATVVADKKKVGLRERSRFEELTAMTSDRAKAHRPRMGATGKIHKSGFEYKEIPDLQKYSKGYAYLKREQQMLDAHETKAKSIEFRRNALERQKVANYQNEHDRITGALSQTILPRHISRASLAARQAELIYIGAISVDDEV